ncbi:hypothetical protein R3P38DRAFT_2949067 [Favolaschia claudopus]|uniref:Uncharacterized protein n=1 Tax=Favolaschia claudopus TaxID=2862362 RepID=A0AAW0BJ91_9AGAR
MQPQMDTDESESRELEAGVGRLIPATWKSFPKGLKRLASALVLFITARRLITVGSLPLFSKGSLRSLERLFWTREFPFPKLWPSDSFLWGRNWSCGCRIDSTTQLRGYSKGFLGYTVLRSVLVSLSWLFLVPVPRMMKHRASCSSGETLREVVGRCQNRLVYDIAHRLSDKTVPGASS